MSKKEEKDLTLTEDDESVEEYVAVEEAPEKEDFGDSKREDDDSPDEEDAPKVVSEEEDAEGDDAEREKIRARRREERKLRKQRRDEAVNRDRTELDFLRNRNDDLERRLTGVEHSSKQTALSNLKTSFEAARADVAAAEQIIAKAVEAGEGEDVAKAMRYRDEAMMKVNRLGHVIKTQSNAKQAPQQKAPVVPNVKPIVQEHAKDFMDEHSWYNPAKKDEASSIVLAIDNSLAAEGFNPESEEYWDELRDRIRLRLPEKFENEKKAPPAKREQRGGPRVGSGKEHAPRSSRRAVYINPERKAALIEAGVWDDPILRQKYIKRYAEYDKNV